MAAAKQLYLFDFLNEAEEAQTSPALPYFPQPNDDNELLLSLQSRYISNRDRQALDEIYCISKKVCAKFIKKTGNKNANVRRLPAAEVEEKAHNASAYVISQYLERPGWFIKKSFTAYLYLRVQHELFYHTKMDDLTDFVGVDPDIFAPPSQLPK